MVPGPFAWVGDKTYKQVIREKGVKRVKRESVYYPEVVQSIIENIQEYQFVTGVMSTCGGWPLIISCADGSRHEFISHSSLMAWAGAMMVALQVNFEE